MAERRDSSFLVEISDRVTSVLLFGMAFPRVVKFLILLPQIGTSAMMGSGYVIPVSRDSCVMLIGSTIEDSRQVCTSNVNFENIATSIEYMIHFGIVIHVGSAYNVNHLLHEPSI